MKEEGDQIYGAGSEGSGGATASGRVGVEGSHGSEVGRSNMVLSWVNK